MQDNDDRFLHVKCNITKTQKSFILYVYINILKALNISNE